LSSRSYKNYNANTIKNELKATNWQHVRDCNDSNLCWQFIKGILTNIIDRHAPVKKKTIKGQPCPWLTEDIKKQMNDLDGLLRKARKSKHEHDWIAYK